VIRRTLYSLDTLFGGVLQEIWFVIIERLFRKGSRFGFELLTLRGQQSRLSELADRAGTDKGGLVPVGAAPWPKHNYTDLYSLIFGLSRDSVSTVLEVGIGSSSSEIRGEWAEHANVGASLFMWRDFFPNAQIFGADIDPESLVFSDRISSFTVDQTSSDSVENLRSQLPSSIDVVIDDGLHEFRAGKTLFNGISASLSQHGVYVIEDVHISDFKNYREFFMSLPDFDVTFVSGRRPRGSLSDNRLIVITRR
jgi:hypothetical protein